MTSNLRVGKRVQNDPRKSDIIGENLSDIVGKGVKNHQKSSAVIYERSLNDCINPIWNFAP